jgi:hypothetical protein
MPIIRHSVTVCRRVRRLRACWRRHYNLSLGTANFSASIQKVQSFQAELVQIGEEVALHSAAPVTAILRLDPEKRSETRLEEDLLPVTQNLHNLEHFKLEICFLLHSVFRDASLNGLDTPQALRPCNSRSDSFFCSDFK